MRTKNEILKVISEHKEELSKFGVSKLGLFGSYARNEQSNNSDIDLLIDFEPEKPIKI
jgi:predicted nucleotidyltransferase